MLRKAKQLNTDLSGEKSKLEKTAAAAAVDTETIESLRAEVDKGESELATREERELLLQSELTDLQVLRDELQEELDGTRKKQMAELQPRIDEIEAALTEVRAENEAQKAALAKAHAEHDELKERALVSIASVTATSTRRVDLGALANVRWRACAAPLCLARRR